MLGRLDRLGTDAGRARAGGVGARARERARGRRARPASISGRPSTAADQLLSAGILTEEPLTFVHPLLRLAVYEQIPPARRADDHRRAALSLAASGGSTLAVGAHLLRASPSGDQEVVELLMSAATRRARRRRPRGRDRAAAPGAWPSRPTGRSAAAVLGQLGPDGGARARSGLRPAPGRGARRGRAARRSAWRWRPRSARCWSGAAGARSRPTRCSPRCSGCLGPDLDPRLQGDARDAADGDRLGRRAAGLQGRRAARAAARAGRRRRALRSRPEDLRRLLVGADRGCRGPLVGSARGGARRRPLRRRADRRLTGRDLCGARADPRATRSSGPRRCSPTSVPTRAPAARSSRTWSTSPGARFCGCAGASWRRPRRTRARRSRWPAGSMPAGSRSGWSPACARRCASRASSRRPPELIESVAARAGARDRGGAARAARARAPARRAGRS